MHTFTIALIFGVLAAGTFAAPAPEPTANNLFDRGVEGIPQYEPAENYEDGELYREKKSYGAHAAPAYAPPAHAYAAPAYAPSKLTYSAPAPSIPCSKSIIVSCAPSVQIAPCSGPPASY